MITRQDLVRRGAYDLRGALALAAGIDIAPGGDGGPASSVPEFWGLREFDAFLLLIDGIPWGGAFNPALATLDLAGVDRIEVLRGAAPVMYGATSFVGVINVIHREPGSGPKSLRVAGGSYGTGAADLYLPLPAWGKLQSSLSADFDRAGFRDDRTDWKRAHLLWQGKRSLGAGTVRLGLDGIWLRQNPASPHPRAGTILSPDVPLDANHNPAGSHLNERRITLNSAYNRRGNAHGGDFDYFVNLDGSDPPSSGSLKDAASVRIRDRRNFWGLYAQVEWGVSDDWRFVLGSRLNRTAESRHVDSFEFSPPARDSGADRRRVWRGGGFAGAIWTPWRRQNDSFSIYANYRDTYKPAAIDFGLDSRPEILAPETAASYEGGVKTRWIDDRLMIDVSAFQMDFRNLVFAQTVSGLPVLTNGGTQRFRGIELEAAAKLGNELSWRTVYSLHDARFRNFVTDIEGVPTQLDGNRLEMSPRNIAATGLVYGAVSGNGWLGSVQANWVGSRFSNRKPIAARVRINNWVSVRGTLNQIDINKSYSASDIDYDGKFKLGAYGVLADLHPFRGRFRLTGGFLDNRNAFRLHARPTRDVTIGGMQYTPSQVGVLRGDVDFKSGVAYAGIGYGEAAKGPRRIHFVFDLGAMFQGKPDVGLSSSTGVIAASDLRKEESKVKDKAPNFWPVLALGASFAF